MNPAGTSFQRAVSGTRLFLGWDASEAPEQEHECESKVNSPHEQQRSPIKTRTKSIRFSDVSQQLDESDSATDNQSQAPSCTRTTRSSLVSQHRSSVRSAGRRLTLVSELSASFWSHRGTQGRTSMTLASPDLLRATSPAVLLACAGQRLKSSVGSAMAADPDSDFAKSFTVETIDIFMSHSWQANRWLKYFTLLVYFNGLPAICIMLFAIAMVKGHCRAVPDFCEEQRHLYLSVGMPTFVLSLLTWHYVLTWFRYYSIFLDKICIHQTDMDKKASGIKSIGSFLANSRMLLVVWDRSYFERLWCAYELAAFTTIKSWDEVLILPVMLGGFAAMYTLALIVSVVVSTIGAPTWVHILMTFCGFAVSSNVFVTYLLQVGALKDQLMNFAVRESKCFCCSVHHKHPQTNAELSCDRTVVYASIAHWCAGLDNFDEKIRGGCLDVLTKTLGMSQIPYRFAILSGVSAALDTWDRERLADYSDHSWFISLLINANALFVDEPLSIALFIMVVRRSWNRLAPLRQVTRSAILGLLLSVLFHGTSWLPDYFSARRQVHLQICWFTLKPILLIIFYLGKAAPEAGQKGVQQDISLTAMSS